MAYTCPYSSSGCFNNYGCCNIISLTITWRSYCWVQIILYIGIAFELPRVRTFGRESPRARIVLDKNHLGENCFGMTSYRYIIFSEPIMPYARNLRVQFAHCDIGFLKIKPSWHPQRRPFGSGKHTCSHPPLLRLQELVLSIPEVK